MYLTSLGLSSSYYENHISVDLSRRPDGLSKDVTFVTWHKMSKDIVLT